MAFHWQSKATQAQQQGVEDMVLLSKVQDDAITENLKKRYMADLMYTYIGPTLVAVNPYKKLGYFTDNEIRQYRGAATYENPPHIYALADKMYQSMVANEENQCVIISGESGAGKTESAKLIMNYIAAVSDQGGAMNNVVDHVKKIILGTNPLLESFGNAKTLRNNNSSRFGKYFEILFSRGGSPIGGKISNFLLEKSRVVGPGQGERNFHIFYQITAGAGPNEVNNLGMSGPENFRYLSVSEEYSADGIDDVSEYADMTAAMNVCGISKNDQQSILEIVAGVLHLGNIAFEENGNNAIVFDRKNYLQYPAHLLGITPDLLNDKLTSRIMTTGGFGRRTSSYNVPLNVQQATNTRDALAKALYSRMFDWIIQAVNNALKNISTGLKGKTLCLGVLDIFGFEVIIMMNFNKNGFEQFCINYVNEKLQQIFIELTLKQEQEEYVAEGIKWTPIDYFNNKIVVDLIESKKPPGLMAVLDDVCLTMHAVTEGADEKFIQKADAACGQHKHFQGMSTHFKVQHYAGSVVYDCEGFCEANKDTLFKDLVQLMQTTNKPFIRALFPETVDDTDKKRPTTVSHKIKNQSQELVDTLMRAIPSYVRCIKPNETKKSKDWENARVVHQVRYLNLKENIKVRRAGFCLRDPFDRFLRRFAILHKDTFPSWSGPPQRGIELIMSGAEIDPKEWQIGKSKVFIKSPESLFLLEESRDRKYHGYATIIQRAYRSWKARKYFVELKGKSSSIVYGKKERKRHSINRSFVGDYLNCLDNPVLRAFAGNNERIWFAAEVDKYDRKFKSTTRELLITSSHVIIIGYEKEKSGPNKGKLVQVIKRKLTFVEIGSVSMSTLADDFFVLHIPSEFDQVLECVFKTELVTVLAERYENATRSQLFVDLTDRIRYSVKSTTFQRGGEAEIVFRQDDSCTLRLIKNNGKTTEISVARGLPKDTKPTTSIAPRARASSPKKRTVVTKSNQALNATGKNLSAMSLNNSSPQASPSNGSAIRLDPVAVGYDVAGSADSLSGARGNATIRAPQQNDLVNALKAQASRNAGSVESLGTARVKASGSPGGSQSDVRGSVPALGGTIRGNPALQGSQGDVRGSAAGGGTIKAGSTIRGNQFNPVHVVGGSQGDLRNSGAAATIRLQNQINPAVTGSGTIRGAPAGSQGNLTGSQSSLAQKKAPPAPPPKKLPQCRALYDYEAQEADELSFKVGDVIIIVSKEDEGWWIGTCKGKKGLFPANYTEPV